MSFLLYTVCLATPFDDDDNDDSSVPSVYMALYSEHSTEQLPRPRIYNLMYDTVKQQGEGTGEINGPRMHGESAVNRAIIRLHPHYQRRAVS